MNTEEIIAALKEERQRIDQVLQILTGHASTQPEPVTPTPKPRKKRNMTPDGRARIAAAVKARWAKQKKAAK